MRGRQGRPTGKDQRQRATRVQEDEKAGPEGRGERWVEEGRLGSEGQKEDQDEEDVSSRAKKEKYDIPKEAGNEDQETAVAI